MVAFNGTKGRLDQKVVEQAFVAGAAVGQSTVAGDDITTTFTPLRGRAQVIPVRNVQGDHGGGDTALLADLFDPAAPADPLLRHADYRAGAAAMLVGAAANVSFRTGQTVMINDLVKGLERPDQSAMPGHNGPVPMPVSTRQM